MKHNKTFLGIGWKFPPEFDRQTKTVTLVSEEEDIRESLYILLSTRPGERVLQPNYGCALSVLNFESINEGLINKASEIIHDAVLHFEPRIVLENVDVSTKQIYDGILEISLEYTVRKTNKRNNIVYPYYLLEGTDVIDMPENL
ncbi:MAG TPA: GPW/gp25 family protein [Bacteroidales bacterium]|nr:GPW/gp25 family protein [Bacteroidales bacterium]